MACLSHQNTAVRIAAMRATCSFILVRKIGESAVHMLRGLVTCISSSALGHTSHRSSAQACRSVQDLDEASDRDKFQSTTGPMMECIMHSLNVGEEGSAQEALEMFIEVRRMRACGYLLRCQRCGNPVCCVAETSYPPSCTSFHIIH